MKSIPVILSLVFATLAPIQSYGWEAYEFDVSYVRVIAGTSGSNGSCRIGMTNLGPKMSSDAAICDDPVELRISDCGSDIGKTMISVLLAAQTAGKRAYSQAIAEVTSSPCRVAAHQVGIETQ